MLIPQNNASLPGRPKANRSPLATKTTIARQNASAAGRWVMPALSANTGITLAIPVEEPVTSPRCAKANHKRLTRWKKQSLLRSVLMIQLIHSRLHCAIWARVAMALRYQSN